MDQERFDRITRTLATAQSRRGLLKGLTGTAIGGLLAPVGLAEARAQGNSANAKRCQNGNWATLAPSDDPTTPFASQGACVSYGARGGTIVKAGTCAPNGACGMAPTLSVSFAPNPDGKYSNVYVTGAGLQHYAEVTFTPITWGDEALGTSNLGSVSETGTFTSEAGPLLCGFFAKVVVESRMPDGEPITVSETVPSC